MNKSAILLCLLASPVLAEPPDWYAHIPAEQRAALLATRHGGAAGAAIGAGSPATYRGPASVAYAAPQLDLSRIGEANLSLEHHRLREARVRRILRQFRQPDVYEPLTVRGVRYGEHRRYRHERNEEHQFR